MSNFKVVLLGEGSVGKTSIVLRYCKDQFNDQHVITIQASFLSKRLNIGSDRVNLAIWDTAGQERFHALGPIYYRDANGALLVYDITDKDSFLRVKHWVKELRRMLGKEIVLSIAGNKCDMDKSRVVSIAEAEEYAASVGAKHYSTSAKANQGIEEMFLDIAKRLLSSKASSSSMGGMGGGMSGGSIIIGEDDEAPAADGENPPSNCSC